METCIDELYESFFESTGKEVGFPMSIRIKSRERKEYKDTKSEYVWVWALMHQRVCHFNYLAR